LSLSDTIGNAYWFIFFAFSAANTGYSRATAGIAPSASLIEYHRNSNILAAVLITAVGWLLATVRRCNELAGLSWI